TMSEMHRAILDTSVKLVAEQGVRGVSFREVARRAGVSHQAPYHHFGNLQGILRAITREGFSKLTASMRAAAHEAGPEPLDALIAAGVAYVTFAMDHLGYFRVMFEPALVDIHAEDEPIEEAAETYTTLQTLTGAAWDAGYGRSLQRDIMAHLCWATVHGLAILIFEGILASKGVTPEEQEQHTQSVVAALGSLLDADRRLG
ncbi:MAG: TetR/AcrR family transcriptional regulator, partial [Myxococcota bacterium]